MTLTEFLLARISEDEADRVIPVADDWPFTRSAVEVTESDRWRAECEAKRRIVQLHEILDGGQPEMYPYVSEYDGRTYWPPCALCDEGSPDRPYCDTLRALAAVYADHPDYDPSWALDI